MLITINPEKPIYPILGVGNFCPGQRAVSEDEADRANIFPLERKFTFSP